MTGGLLQLVAKGPDDIYIIDDPQITFFKIVYRRHTNFCMYPCYLNFDKELDFGQSSKCRLRAKGDMITQLYLEIVLPDIYMDLNKVKRIQIKQILKEYSIQWNYFNYDDEIVTFDIYEQEIIPLIENKINELISNLNTFQSDLNYLEKQKNFFKKNSINNIKNIIISKNNKKKNYCDNSTLNTNDNIQDGVDLAQSVIKNKIKSSEYINILKYLINQIKILRQEEIDLITELYLYNFDDIINAVYNFLVKSYSIQGDYPILNNVYDYGDILLYNIIDLGNYIFLSGNVGSSVSTFFNNVIQNSLAASDFENNIMSIIILQNYFLYLDQQKKIMTNSSDILKFKIEILNNLEWNIKKTISVLRSLMQVIVNTNVKSQNSFRIGIIKTYKLVSPNQYVSIDQFNTIKNLDTGLQNNFFDLINQDKLPNEPADIQHFFGTNVINEYKKFEDNLMINYRTLVDSNYFEDLTIWQKLIADNDYDQILIMNLIPIFLIKDIPNFVYENIFQIEILKQNKEKFGEKGIAYILKKVLEEEISKNIIIDKEYLNSIKKNFVNKSDKLLMSIFSPEYLYKLSHDKKSKNYELLIKLEEEKINNKNLDLNKLLSIEYIILNYLLIYFEIIDTISTDSQEKEDLKRFIYEMLKIFRYNDFYDSLPLYNSYVANGFSLYQINSKIFEEIIDHNKEPKYVDVICSIYYDFQKKNIKEYNNFFNNILSYNLIQKIIGQQMSKIMILFNNNKTINYYYDEDYIQDRGQAIIDIYLNVYLKVFSNDMLNYKKNKDVYGIKNIFFRERINNYYKTKKEMTEYLIEILIKQNPSFKSIIHKINQVVKDLDYQEHLTAFEFIEELKNIINNESILTEKDKELFEEIILKNINFNDNFNLYFEQKKLGMFNSFKSKVDVVQYIIYLISESLNLTSIYNNVYSYKSTDSLAIEPLNVYIAKLNDTQVNELSNVEFYNIYHNISVRILMDYKITIQSDRDILKYYNILDSFSDKELKKYDITKENIIILKIVYFINYYELRTILLDKPKFKQIKNDVDTLNNIIKMEQENNYNSLIHTYENFKKYYLDNIKRIKILLNKISILKKTSKLKYQKEDISNRIYQGSELENRLISLIGSTSQNFRWVKELGHYITENVSIEIGGQIIEEHDYDWNRIQHLIFFDKNKKDGYNKMIGNIPELYFANKNIKDNKVKDSYILLIPLNFWFSQYYQLALPLVALQYTDIDITVKLKNIDEVAIWNNNAKFIKKPKLKCQVLANYIYVEEEERKKLCENRQENLIEMVQRSGEIIIGKNDININNVNIETHFNNSSKFIFGYIKFVNNNQSREDKFNWTDDTIYKIEKIINTETGEEISNNKKINPIKNIIIKFNGKIRESKKEYEYYNLVQSYKSNSGTLSDNMFLYSFALDVTALQPSGTVNMSKINNLIITFELDDFIVEEINKGNIIGKVKIYNYSYNILRIMSGLAGLAFYS